MFCLILFIEAATVTPGDGSYKLMVTLNGTVPGPPVVVYKGQTVCNVLSKKKHFYHNSEV